MDADLREIYLVSALSLHTFIYMYILIYVCMYIHILCPNAMKYAGNIVVFPFGYFKIMGKRMENFGDLRLNCTVIV